MSTSDNSHNKGSGKWRASVIKSPLPGQAEAALQASRQYDNELAEVLRSRDVFRFRNFLAAHDRGLPGEMMLDTLKMATLMHQLIQTLPQLADLHEFSREWLNDNTALPKDNGSLNQAAKRSPGVPPPEPGRRTITLRSIPPSQN